MLQMSIGVAFMTGQACGGPDGPGTEAPCPVVAVAHRIGRSTRSRLIPEATVGRLAVYLQVLTDPHLHHLERQVAHGIVSSAELAAAAGVNPAGLRRDLSFLGSHGVRGVGYHVANLVDEIRRVLGAHHHFRVALVGIGNLGQALAGYEGFGARGFDIAALFDVDNEKIGRSLGGVLVRHLSEAAAVCPAESITIGLIATPESVAQQVADALVGAGIHSILNFAPGLVTVPEGVEVRRVDLSLELQMLAFHETSRVAGSVVS
jgi:redox-sensing transcriptional repressor